MNPARSVPAIGLLVALLAMAAPLPAQQSEKTRLSDFVSMRAREPDDIVVTGRPTDSSNREVTRQARKISQVSGSVLHEPLAQMRKRICPGIIGLPQDMAEMIVGRIRYNAERIGMPAASEEACDPNIVVAFVRDGKAEVAALVETQPQVFSRLPRAELQALLAEAGPVRAWSNTVVRSRHGDQLMGRTDNLVDIPMLNVGNSHSHIFAAHRYDIDSAVILIDLAAIDGMLVSQIADYVTMRSFARTRPVSGDTAADTILSLFDPEGAAPSGLTTFDLAYLKSLYDSYDSLRAIAPIAGTAKALRKAEAEERDGTAQRD